MCGVVGGWVTRAAGKPRALGLTPKDRRTILAALADSAESRENSAGAWCDGCARAAAGACDRHAADLDAAAEYRAAAARIGGDI